MKRPSLIQFYFALLLLALMASSCSRSPEPDYYQNEMKVGNLSMNYTNVLT